MLNIFINGKAVKLLQETPVVNSVEIQHIPGIQIPIQKELIKPIAEWLYLLTQQVDGYIEYNKVLIPKEDINKPAHMK